MIDSNPFQFGASRVHHGLYQGSRPEPLDEIVSVEDYEVVVFCAYEHRDIEPAKKLGIEALSCPLIEDSFPPHDAEMANETAKLVAARVAEGKKVLVSCMFGRNRSGLGTALALHHLFGWPGTFCLDWVRRMRKGSLMNHRMNEYLLSKDRKEGLRPDPFAERHAGSGSTS